MTDTTNAAPADPFAAMAAPIRAAFTAAMSPYTNGEATAPAALTVILTEAVTTAEPTAELIGMLCQLLTTADPDADTLSIMHRAMGAALGIGITAVSPRYPRVSAQAAPPATSGTSGGTRPGSIGARILEVFSANPGAQYTVTELARQLGNGTGATGAAINGLINRGEVALTGEHPRRYAALGSATAADTDSDEPDEKVTAAE